MFASMKEIKENFLNIRNTILNLHFVIYFAISFIKLLLDVYTKAIQIFI